MWLQKLLAPAELREPAYLWLSLGLLALLALTLLPKSRVRFSSLRLLPSEGQSLRTRFYYLPQVLLGGAALALVVALSGPRVPDRSQRIEREGIAIMMAIDISSSMQALDLSESRSKEETRLDAVKRVFVDFVGGDSELSGRPDDAIGIISFAGFADTRCPLTLDHSIVMQVAGDLDIVSERREDGTAVGDGLGLAVERLRTSDAKSKVVILLTDGVNNRGADSPLSAAKLASEEGIKVYTIGAGTNGNAKVRVRNPFTGQMEAQMVEVQIDEETLSAIAAETGGQYFRATDASALRDIYKSINTLEKVAIGEERFRDYRELYTWFLALALLLAALGWGLEATVLRRLP